MKKRYTYSRRARPLFTLVLLFLSFLFFSNNASAQGYVAGSRIWANTGTDSTHGLVADPTGNSYILVSAPNTTFPVTLPGTPAGGTHRSVLIKMAPDGNIIWSKYLPGSPTVTSYYKNIAYSNGTLFLLGRTTATNMPVTNGSVNNGDWDMIYAAVDAGSGSLISTSYLGGSRKDGAGLNLAAENGFAYISYTTTSSDIPVTTATSYSGGNDRIVQKLDVNGNIIYSTYIGSLSTTEATAALSDISVDNGLVAIAGILDDTHAFPVSDGSTPKGEKDFAVTKLNADGTISFNTIYGGTGNEAGVGL